MTSAIRAAILLAVGAALRDCALLAAGVLLLCANHRDRLDDIPDRAHAWLRCLIGGALLVTAGSVLAAHTGSVFFGWWPVGPWRLPMGAWVFWALPPIVALGGLAWREITLPHAVAALGAPAAMLAALHWAPWAPCAFAALAALYAVADGARQLGPMARGLAASHLER